MPSYMLPPPKSGMPAWLTVLLVAGGLIGLGFGLLSYLRSGGSGSTEAAAEPAKAAKAAAKPSDHPYAKMVEVAGLRVSESANQKLDIRMVVINHAAGELQDFKLQVDLNITNAKPGTPPITTFTVKVPPIPALGMRDVRATAATQLRAYEFPDWQFLRADFTVLAP